jgi:hypothetical protein
MGNVKIVVNSFFPQQKNTLFLNTSENKLVLKF